MSATSNHAKPAQETCVESMLIYVALAVAIWLIVRANLWAMRPNPVWLNQDEGYIGALAMRMIHGRWLPYVDGVSHRGPILYYVAALWMRLFGVTLDAIRSLGLVVSVTVALLVFAVGRAATRPFVGAIATLVWAISTVGWEFPPGDAIAVNGELVADAFLLAALTCLTATLRNSARRPKLVMLFCAGMLGGLAILTKQTALVAVFPFFIWLAAAALARTQYPKRLRWRWLLAFATGLAFPFSVICLRYGAAGELSTFWYYFFRYNQEVYMSPLRGNIGRDQFADWIAQNLPALTVSAGLVVAMVSSFVSSSRRAEELDRNGFGVIVVVGTFLVALTVNAPLRGFGHYYVSLFPWAGLLLGHVLERAVMPAERDAIPRAAMLAMFSVAAYWGWNHQFRTRIAQNVKFPPVNASDTPLCRYIHEHTPPGGSTFIWGFYAEPYVSCAVAPASRYVYTTFPSGVVPWFESTLSEENARAVPGSRALLLRELESSKPHVILDSRGSLMGRSITRYPEFAEYMNRHYCQDGSLIYGDLYLRRAEGRACPRPQK